MSYATQRTAIQSHIVTHLSTSVVAAANRAWDNVDFEIPKTNVSWIRISIQNNVSNHVSAGPNKLTRREGFVIVQVFVPQNTETDEMLTIVDAVVNVFETKLASGLQFRSPNVREIGSTDKWFQTNISVPFQYDDITTFS